MKKSSMTLKLLVTVSVLSSILGAAMTVDKSNGMLTVISDKPGVVIAKIVGPDDETVVYERYEGDTFTWSPSGEDGAYRYDVRVIFFHGEEGESDYAGGSIEVRNSEMTLDDLEGDDDER